MSAESPRATSESRQILPQFIHSHRPQKSLGHNRAPLRNPSLIPPISLPHVHEDTAETSVIRTRLVQKSNSIHTSNPSSSTIPYTPTSGKLMLPFSARSLAPLNTSDEFMQSSASFLKRPLIRPKSPTISRYQTHPVIALPRRWQSLPLSLETLPSAPEFPQNDLSRSPEKPPSPATTKRKQFSKLRRTLGASLPPELVCGEVRLIAIKPPVLETVLEEERAYVYLTLPPGSHEEQDSCEECQSAECGQGNVLEPQWEFPPMPFEACTTHQCSKSQYGGKWMREKDGRRWLVTNYDDVIRALREL